jgi:hypothetical protein
MYIDIVCTKGGAQLLWGGGGGYNIPTIIPSLINAYVDIMCSYDQSDVYVKRIYEF